DLTQEIFTLGVRLDFLRFTTIRCGRRDLSGVDPEPTTLRTARRLRLVCDVAHGLLGGTVHELAVVPTGTGRQHHRSVVKGRAKVAVVVGGKVAKAKRRGLTVARDEQYARVVFDGSTTNRLEQLDGL